MGMHFAGTRQRHANMRSGIIAAFGSVGEIIAVFRHEPLEEFRQINSRRVIGVFENDEAGAGVLQKNCGRAGANAALPNDSFDLVGDFVGAFALRRDNDCFGMRRHGCAEPSAPALIASMSRSGSTGLERY